MHAACCARPWGPGAKVVVTGEAGLLSELDVALWTFAPLEFVPHCRDRGAPAAVWPLRRWCWPTRRAAAPHHQVLVNLGGTVPEGFEGFERLIEVVTGDESDRLQARERWKHYAARGYAITRHDRAREAQ